ncbi:hypothetical protein ABZS96_44660, partial [Streptomyces avermitilis]
MKRVRIDVDRRVQKRAHLVIRSSEHRIRLVEFAPHADPLRALTREQEPDLAPDGTAHRSSAGNNRLQPLPELPKLLP